MKHVVLFVLIIALGMSSSAQDIHFSQFDQNPLKLNPAFTGMHEGAYRFNLNYKNQWAAISNVYETYSVSTDFSLFKNRSGKKSTGLGLSAYQDQAGASKTKTTKIELTLSQTVYLSKNSNLTLGVGFSYLDFSANFHNLNWGTQFDGAEFDQTIGSGESIFGYAEQRLDLSAGMLFRRSRNGLNPFEIGVSFNNLARPTFVILGKEDYIPIRINAHFLKEQTLSSSKDWGLKLTGNFSVQKSAQEFIVGGFMRKDFISEAKYTRYGRGISFYFGGYYRVGDAVIPSFLLTINRRISIGMSYDYTVSNLSNYNSFRGGPEFSFSFLGPIDGVSVKSPLDFN